MAARARPLAAGLMAGLLGMGCGPGAPANSPDSPDARGDAADFRALRERMVREQIEARGIDNARVLAALRETPRHRFVPAPFAARAYADGALPIGLGQTISQPYIVAAMTELLNPEPGDRVLEVGTGSGYQAAVLARLVAQVHSVEIIPELAERARQTLSALDIANVQVITGDGWRGLPQHAPFDGILVTAAPEETPPALLEQLAPGARMVIPVGGAHQELFVFERGPQGISRRSVFPVRFVPLVREPGAAQR